jgi:hypothetical protein
MKGWPQYRPTITRKRVLAIWRDNRLTTEHGEWTEISDWSTLKQAAKGLDIYVDRLLECEWFYEAIEDPDVTIIATQSMSIRMIKWRSGRNILSVNQVDTWLHGWPASPQFLSLLRRFFDHCQVGELATPASLGMYLMSKLYEGPRQAEPNIHDRQLLLEHMVGGRDDLLQKGAYSLCYEYDIRSAYASNAQIVPCGTSIKIYGERPDLASYFSHCQIVIRDDLLLGIFPILQNEKNSYPTISGIYDVWLWNDEIARCKEAGCFVVTKEGIGWQSFTQGLSVWSTAMDTLRSSVPEDIASLIKLATVAAIGRFGVSPYRLKVVHDRDKQDGDEPLDIGYQPHSWLWVRREYTDGCYMTHWSSYIQMHTRVALYDRMLAEIGSGNVVLMSNFDGLYTLYPSKLEVGQNVGDWQFKRAHTNAFIPYARAIISDQKNIQPGMPLKSRNVM